MQICLPADSNLLSLGLWPCAVRRIRPPERSPAAVRSLGLSGMGPVPGAGAHCVSVAFAPPGAGDPITVSGIKPPPPPLPHPWPGPSPFIECTWASSDPCAGPCCMAGATQVVTWGLHVERVMSAHYVILV